MHNEGLGIDLTLQFLLQVLPCQVHLIFADLSYLRKLSQMPRFRCSA